MVKCVAIGDQEVPLLRYLEGFCKLLEKSDLLLRQVVLTAELIPLLFPHSGEPFMLLLLSYLMHDDEKSEETENDHDK